MARVHPAHKGSIVQVMDKGHLETLLRDKAEILQPHFHYEASTRILSVEDPKMIFFLRNLVWRQFTRIFGFYADFFGGQYDFALSFAGKNRVEAECLFEIPSEREVSVFYDENEQRHIIDLDIEEYRVRLTERKLGALCLYCRLNIPIGYGQNLRPIIFEADSAKNQ